MNLQIDQAYKQMIVIKSIHYKSMYAVKLCLITMIIFRLMLIKELEKPIYKAKYDRFTLNSGYVIYPIYTISIQK